jgi:hypothetical protein
MVNGQNHEPAALCLWTDAPLSNQYTDGTQRREQDLCPDPELSLNSSVVQTVA